MRKTQPPTVSFEMEEEELQMQYFQNLPMALVYSQQENQGFSPVFAMTYPKANNPNEQEKDFLLEFIERSAPLWTPCFILVRLCWTFCLQNLKQNICVLGL